MDFGLIEDMQRHIGQTVTIFTSSGGLSGSGFTGVLICIEPKVIKLLCDEGAPPACPVGSACCGFENWGNNNGWDGFGWNNWNGGNGNCGCGCGSNPFGAVAVIPVHSIVAFVHHAI